jgi:hypothetical protein
VVVEKSHPRRDPIKDRCLPDVIQLHYRGKTK